MKKTLWLLFLVPLIVGCSAQAATEEMSSVGKALQGEHELRKVGDSYFTPMKEDNMILFSWKTNDGVYATSWIDVRKIRIVFSESVDVPLMKFRWIKGGESSLEEIFKNKIVYIVLTCKESDWKEVEFHFYGVKEKASKETKAKEE